MDEQRTDQMPRREIEGNFSNIEVNVEHLRIRVTDIEKTVSGFKARDIAVEHVVERHQDMTMVYLGLSLTLLLGAINVIMVLAHISK